MKYRNITLNFSYLNPQLQDVIGEANYTYCDNAARVLTNHFEEDEVPYFLQDLLTNMQEGDRVDTLADTFIIAMCVLDEYEDQQFTIDVEYSHIIWLFHDLSHVRYDATTSDIYVDSGSEAEAVKNSIRLCVENKVDIPWDILSTVETEYQTRFHQPLDLAYLRAQLGIEFGNTNNYTFKSLE